MIEPIAGGQGETKASAVADAVNTLLNEVIITSWKGRIVKDRIYVGVIGYGTNEADAVDYAKPAFSHPNLGGRYLIPISEIADNVTGFRSSSIRVQVENFETREMEEITEEIPYWFEPKAYGKTPMCQAFGVAYDILKEWVDAPKHRDCFPPMVINITDGMPTDGGPDDLLGAAKKIMDLSTNDGNALVYNCHISSGAGDCIKFPSDTAGIADELAVALFEASSIIPDEVRNKLRHLEGNMQLSPGARGFVFNAQIIDLVLTVARDDGDCLPDMLPEK
jgi:hypothetical protein